MNPKLNSSLNWLEYVFSECFMGLQPLYKSTNTLWAKIVIVAALSVLGFLCVGSR